MNGSAAENLSLELDFLLPRLHGVMPEILASRPVMLAYLHGSVVDGLTLPDSDVDIAIVLSPDCNLSAYQRMLLEFDIAAEIENRCQIREADVRSINQAPLTVQGHVLTEGVLLYSRDEEFRVEYEKSTRLRYLDFLPVAERMRAAFFENLRTKGFR